METAGRQVDDEDMREAMKDCGLGTPATRAQILERLISVGYINREQNRLIPTDKGIYLIENIQDKELLSPKLTGDWEKKLNDMAQGTFKREDYMAGISEFTSKVVDTLKNSSEGSDLVGQDPIGTCPICKKGEVFETMKTFTCSGKNDETCDFTIWKMIAKKAITKAIATTLVVDGKTKLITGFKSRVGKFFDASLEIKEGKISFNFDREPVGDCPVCDDGKIIVTSRAFSCSNWKLKSCPFTIWKVIAGKQISEDVVLSLAADGKVDELSGFKSKTGKYFSAGLELIEGKAQLIFKDKE
jgi:DNA topoisomerase III